jgi:serine/threonine protein phosphatase 1
MATYVISDIHGMGDKFDALFNVLSSSDIVYVLGDVIDRGPDGIRILQAIMRDRRFKMLLGNHEHMMLDFIECLNISVKNSLVQKELMKKYNRWCVVNGGETTFSAYEKLTSNEQKEILEFLKNLPVAYQNVQAGSHQFYLVHSKPGSKSLMHQEIVYREDILEIYDLHSYIWNRPEYIDDYWLNDEDERIVVAGHTMTLNFHDTLEVFCAANKNHKLRYINIDCGCAMQNEDSKLACLCLDHLKIQYF